MSAATPGASFFREGRAPGAASWPVGGGVLAATEKPWLAPMHLDVLRALGYPVTVVDPKTG